MRLLTDTSGMATRRSLFFKVALLVEVACSHEMWHWKDIIPTHDVGKDVTLSGRADYYLK